MSGEKIQLEQKPDGKRRNAVQQRTAEQIAEARRTQRTVLLFGMFRWAASTQRTLGDKRFRAAESGFRVVDGQVMTADFA